MPSRWLSVAIVFFWLATTGWLFWHDLWPQWRPGEPPPFHIDLVEEVQRGGTLKNLWMVERDKGDDKGAQKVFNASTWAEYHAEDDTFTLHAEFKTPLGVNASLSKVSLPKADVKRMKSEYRVNRQGQLQSLQANIEGELHLKNGITMDGEASLWGEVREEQFFSHYRLRVVGSSLEGDLKVVPVSHHGSILMPLHPVNRIHGLRPGRTWRQALVDPFRDAFPSLPGLGGVHYLQARVLPQPQVLQLSDDTETTCLVIEYEDEGRNVGRTWVEQDSERVQRQEATLEGSDRWIMTRDLASRGRKPPSALRILPPSPDRQPRNEP